MQVVPPITNVSSSSQQVQAPTSQYAMSNFQFQKTADQYPKPAVEPSMLPIYSRLRDMGVNLAVDAQANMRSNAGYKPGDYNDLPIAGYDDRNKKQIVLSSDDSPSWWRIVPREYSHQEVASKNLYAEQSKLFHDDEARADAYTNYWNDPVRFQKENPTQAAWFQKNFVNPTVPAPVQAPRTFTALTTPTPKPPITKPRSLTLKKVH